MISKQTRYIIFLLLAILFAAKGEYVLGQSVEIGGDLTTDRSLFVDTTYIITEDLRVLGGVLLEIEAGTNLRFRQGKGLVVDGGLLHANGETADGIDSIRFIPDHTDPAQSWKWKGIEIRNVNLPDQIVLSYAIVSDAERGIEITNSSGFTVSHSCIINNFWRGISIINSHNIIFENNEILENYVGLEILANGLIGRSFNNIVRENVFRSSPNSTNIFIRTEDNGRAYENVIDANVIYNGVIGIQLDNSAQSASYANIITNNAIINNRNGYGYGLDLGMDSVLVFQNIFWQNNTAIHFFRNSSDNTIQQNSFYENEIALVVPIASRRNRIRNNTFSGQTNKVIQQGEATGNGFLNNNFIHNSTDTIIRSQTSQNINAAGNYWGTISETEIQELIFDVNDDPQLGEVYYLPFLEEPDTTAPLAPPYMLKKQWVNNQVRLSWHPSEEADLYGYRAYFNDFKNYSFSQHSDITFDTVVYLPGLDIGDEIAVTATDGNIEAASFLFQGRESPYAFARPYPYAGSDTAICKQETVFDITQAHNPFSSSQLIWSSDGDGVFLNPNQLQTSYFPSELDYENGSVVLSLDVFTASQHYTERFRLRFNDDPFVFAGSDTLIGIDSTVKLQSAIARFYDQLIWNSLGDGQFDDFTLQNPVYFPGEQDYQTGSVDLVIQAQSNCGLATDTITVFFESVFSLSGSVWNENEAYEGAKLLALRLGNDGFRLLTAVRSDNEGKFLFPALFGGSYVLQAVPDTLDRQLKQVYYAEEAVWQQAHHIQLDAPVEDVDLLLEKFDYRLPDGINKIYGQFEWPEEYFPEASIYCDDWFQRNADQTYCDGGLSNIGIHLYNPGLDDLLATALTDHKGRFYFEDLPYGSYRLHADLPGYPMLTSEIISFAPETAAQMEVSFTLFQKQIFATISEAEAEEFPLSAGLYPNPAADKLYIQSQFSEIYTFIIADISGRIVYEQKVYNEEAEHFLVDVSNLKQGLYIVRLIGDGKTQSLKFVKN